MQGFGAFVVKHQDAIATGALVVGMAACVVASAGVCAVAGGAMFAASVANSIYKSNIVSGNNADWGGFLKSVVIDAALTFGPGAAFKTAARMGYTAKAADAIAPYLNRVRNGIRERQAINGAEVGMVRLPGGKGGDEAGYVYFHGTERPRVDGATPHSIYTKIDARTGKATQNAIYGQNGIVIAHVHFKSYGVESGHGHVFPELGNPGSGHRDAGPHIPNADLPKEWSRLPVNIQLHTPIGEK